MKKASLEQIRKMVEKGEVKNFPMLEGNHESLPDTFWQNAKLICPNKE